MNYIFFQPINYLKILINITEIRSLIIISISIPHNRRMFGWFEKNIEYVMFTVVPYISSNIHLTFPIFLEGNVFACQTLECHRYSIQLRGELKGHKGEETSRIHDRIKSWLDNTRVVIFSAVRSTDSSTFDISIRMQPDLTTVLIWHPIGHTTMSAILQISYVRT